MLLKFVIPVDSNRDDLWAWVNFRSSTAKDALDNSKGLSIASSHIDNGSLYFVAHSDRELSYYWRLYSFH